MDEKNENATTTMEMEEETMGDDKMQASVNEAAMEEEGDGGIGTGMDTSGGDMTKWIMYVVILVVVLGALWFLFLR